MRQLPVSILEFNPNNTEAYFERGQTWRDKGDSARALRDFAEANPIDPASGGSPYFGRAMILRDQRAFADAVTELDHALDRQQMAAWYVERARIKFFELNQLPQAADDFAAAVRAAIKRRDVRELLYGADLEKNWMELGPLYGLMLGKITLSAALAAADAAADDATRKRRQCDADFYLALFRRQTADVDEAQRLLQAAAELCPPETLESSFAKNELQRH